MDTPFAALRLHLIRARRQPRPRLRRAGGDVRSTLGLPGPRTPLCNLNKTPPPAPVAAPALRAALTRRLRSPRLQEASARTSDGGRERGSTSARLFQGATPGRARRTTMRARSQVCEALLFALALQTGVCYGIKWL